MLSVLLASYKRYVILKLGRKDNNLVEEKVFFIDSIRWPLLKCVASDRDNYTQNHKRKHCSGFSAADG